MWWPIVCFGVSGIGLVIRALTVGQAPRGASGRNTREQEASSLTTTGLYSVVRHPLYLGNFLMGLGVSAYPRLWWLSLIFTLAFWLYYERIMFAEEAFLRSKFGDDYLEWAGRTPAFVPALGLYRPAELSFSLKTVLRREYNGFFAVVVLVTFLEAVRRWSLDGRPALAQPWVVGLVLSFGLWVTALCVKRGTTWLNVAGR